MELLKGSALGCRRFTTSANKVVPLAEIAGPHTVAIWVGSKSSEALDTCEARLQQCGVSGRVLLKLYSSQRIAPPFALAIAVKLPALKRPILEGVARRNHQLRTDRCHL